MDGINTTDQPEYTIMCKHQKAMACRGGCGKQFVVSKQTVNAPRCIDCGIKAGVQAMMEMHSKSGPTYGRYKAGMRAYIERIDRQQ